MDPIASDIYNFVSNQLPETGKFLFNHLIKQPIWVLGGATIYLGYTVQQQSKQLRAIEQGNFDGPEAVIGHTEYDFSGEENPVNGEEYIDQTLHTSKNAFDIGQFYNGSSRTVILKTLEKASKLCKKDPEKPSPFQHLDEALKGNKRAARIKSEIIRGFVNGMSDILEDPDVFPERFEEYGGRGDFNPTDEGGRARQEIGVVYPVLVKEPDTPSTQYRVLMFTPEMLDDVVDYDPENVRIKKGPDLFERDPDHHHNDRLKTNQALARDIERNPDLWNKFATDFSTGNYKAVPEPEVSSPE